MEGSFQDLISTQSCFLRNVMARFNFGDWMEGREKEEAEEAKLWFPLLRIVCLSV